MTDQRWGDIAYLECSVQRALLDEVPDNLFAVTAGFRDSEWIVIRGYYYAEPTTDERESLSLAATEVIADFAEGKIEEEYVVASGLSQMEMLDFWALRKSRNPLSSS